MKTLLLHFSILFSIIQIQAQTVFNRAYHDTNENANPFLIEIHGDLYFTSRSFDPSNWGRCNLYKHTSAGILKFKSTVLGASDCKLGLKTSDNKLLFLGYNWSCGGNGSSSQTNFLTKVDTNGTAIFTSTYSVFHNDHPKAAIQYSDSSYYSFTDSLLIKHSKTGQFLFKKNLGLTEISSALLLSNGNILLSAKLNGNNSLVQISNIGIIQSSKAFPGLMNKLCFYGGQKIMGRGFGLDKSYYKISPAMEMITHLTFSTMDLDDFEIKNDTVYSILSSQSIWSSYRITDTLFQTILLTSTNTNSITQNAICLNNNDVNIISTSFSTKQNGYSAGNPNRFISLSRFNKFSNNNYTHDLKVLSITADSLYSTCYPNSLQPGTSICSPLLRAKVKIKNVGNSTISNFRLNCFEHPSIHCGAYFYQETFANLNVLPGDSITVTANRFVRYFSNPYTTSTFTSTFCFYTTLPNGETDKTIEDNEACNTFNFLVTSLKENSKLEQVINIAPNPFNTELMIEADSKISQISIYNTLGQVIKTQEASDKKVNLNNSDLQNGIYILHIETEKGTVIKKVLKN